MLLLWCIVTYSFINQEQTHAHNNYNIVNFRCILCLLYTKWDWPIDNDVRKCTHRSMKSIYIIIFSVLHISNEMNDVSHWTFICSTNMLRVTLILAWLLCLSFPRLFIDLLVFFSFSRCFAGWICWFFFVYRISLAQIQLACYHHYRLAVHTKKIIFIGSRAKISRSTVHNNTAHKHTSTEWEQEYKSR